MTPDKSGWKLSLINSLSQSNWTGCSLCYRKTNHVILWQRRNKLSITGSNVVCLTWNKPQTLSQIQFTKAGTHVSAPFSSPCSQNIEMNEDQLHHRSKRSACAPSTAGLSHLPGGDHDNSLVTGFKWIECRAGRSRSGRRCAVQPDARPMFAREVSIWSADVAVCSMWLLTGVDPSPLLLIGSMDIFFQIIILITRSHILSIRTESIICLSLSQSLNQVKAIWGKLKLRIDHTNKTAMKHWTKLLWCSLKGKTRQTDSGKLSRTGNNPATKQKTWQAYIGEGRVRWNKSGNQGEKGNVTETRMNVKNRKCPK